MNPTATLLLVHTLRTPVIVLIIVAALLSAKASEAQSVRIQNGLGEWGYGWMFRHRGNCVVVLPEHVAGPIPKITVTTAAPVQSDQATVVKPFWAEIDLALAFVDRGPLDERCDASLAHLQPTRSAKQADVATLLRIRANGEEERLPLRILNRKYLTFTGALADPSASIRQGTSGSFAFVEGRPLGMAFQSGQETEAIFMRSEEIALNVGRYLSEQGRAFSAEPTSAAAPADSDTATVALRDLRGNIDPILPQHGIDNLTGEGLWIVEPNGPVVITLRLGEGEDGAQIGRVRLSAPEGTEFAVPKSVTILLDGSTAGNRFRPLHTGEMRPDGSFDTDRFAARNARWMQILIRSAWTDGPMALDRIMVDSP